MFHKKYKIASVHRFFTFIAIVIIIGALIFSVLSNINAVSGMSDVQYYNVLVEPGDTLWSIASESCIYNPETDVRDIIQYISEVNNISAANLRAGDVIRVPMGL